MTHAGQPELVIGHGLDKGRVKTFADLICSLMAAAKSIDFQSNICLQYTGRSQQIVRSIVVNLVGEHTLAISVVQLGDRRTARTGAKQGSNSSHGKQLSRKRLMREFKVLERHEYVARVTLE